MDDIVTELAALRKRIATEYRDEDAVITLNRTVATITALRAALAECADKFEDFIRAKHGAVPPDQYDAMMEKFRADMAPVLRARALLEPATERETTS